MDPPAPGAADKILAPGRLLTDAMISWLTGTAGSARYVGYAQERGWACSCPPPFHHVPHYLRDGRGDEDPLLSISVRGDSVSWWEPARLAREHGRLHDWVR